MAATFVVEDGSGKADANSFVTIAFLDQEFENFGNPTEWTSLSTADKQAEARLATRVIGDGWRNRFKGFRSFQLQALAWPRDDVQDDDGFPVGADEVPSEVQRAVHQVIHHKLVDGIVLLAAQSDPGEIKSEAVGAGRGAVTERIEYVGGKSQEPRLPLVEKILAPLLRAGVSALRG